MSFEDYSSPRPSKWVSLGGKSTKTGKANPTEIEGYYVGSITGPNKFDTSKTKTDYLVKTAEGVVGVSGTANMKRVFTDAEANFAKKNGEAALGASVRIAFTGTVNTGKGNPMKTYAVLFDKTDRTDVLTAAELDSDTEGEDAGDGDEEDYEQEVAAPPPKAASSAAERKAKLDDLLKNKRN